MGTTGFTTEVLAEADAERRHDLEVRGLDAVTLTPAMVPEAAMPWSRVPLEDLVESHAWLSTLHRALRTRDWAALTRWTTEHMEGQAITEDLALVTRWADELVEGTLGQEQQERLPYAVRGAWRSSIQDYLDELAADRPGDADRRTVAFAAEAAQVLDAAAGMRLLGLRQQADQLETLVMSWGYTPAMLSESMSEVA
ncbi:hypothetical protein [Mycobacteroides abscessus]|uniref:hypothetical protein n=1 Tax=Mycobacteroides abscessus TaxID=36809 RepID=UPI0009291C19|nr:hypothetical protein [Mycobacteroides abscessus]SIE26600.1 Uncharacterised protein [Mycobacteroides abscessus subsp. abscessus]SIE51350.1 Uncharacterised protein [Mycobacteroides abscessus subsp. abscessus]